MRASRGEIKIEEILKEYDLNFVEEFSVKGLNSEKGVPLRFDFAVFDDEGHLDFVIEFNGRQHYEPVSKFGGKRGLFQQQHNDNKKKRYCRMHEIPFVEIPYTEENKISYDYIMHKAGY